MFTWKYYDTFFAITNHTISSHTHQPNNMKSLPMPVAAPHNKEERYIPSLQSFVRKKCIEYFANNDEDDDSEYEYENSSIE